MRYSRFIAVVLILTTPLDAIAGLQDMLAFAGKHIGLLCDAVNKRKIQLRHQGLRELLSRSDCTALIMPKDKRKAATVRIHVCELGKTELTPMDISPEDHETLLKWRDEKLFRAAWGIPPSVHPEGVGRKRSVGDAIPQEQGRRVQGLKSIPQQCP
jgi:hypothetical protein